MDFDHGLNNAIKKLREALADDAENPKFVETLPRRGYRFVGALSDGDASIGHPPPEAQKVEALNGRGKLWKVVVPAALGLAAVTSADYFSFHRTLKLTDRDTIVLADLTNTTGDSVFDDVLKQGIAAQLDQSPFLNVLPDQKVQDSLKLMRRSPDERVTPEIARDLCQRVGSKAYLSGAIAGFGSQYAITLNLVNCQTGDSLVHEQVTAPSKEQVLKALGDAARELRGRAGESLASIQKLDAPIDQVTTTSLDALKAYSLGTKIAGSEKGPIEAIPFYKQAVERDPNFASAYASLGTSYMWTEHDLALEYIGKAYQLRDRASEREKMRISNTFFTCQGEYAKALEVAKLWAQEYPRDVSAHNALAFTFIQLGQFENATAEYSEAIRLDPDSRSAYWHLIYADAYLNRLSEAKALYQQALARGLSDMPLRKARSYVAWLENDQAEMDRQVAWAAGKHGVEGGFLGFAAAVEDFHGHLNEARRLRQRVMESALWDNDNQTAAARATLSRRVFGCMWVTKKIRTTYSTSPWTVAVKGRNIS